MGGNVREPETIETTIGHWEISVKVTFGNGVQCTPMVKNLNVYSVEIQWLAGQPNVEYNAGNPLAGGGHRWFPERNVQDGQIFNTLSYRVQIHPEDAGVLVHHKLFDPDDPSAHDNDIDNDPFVTVAGVKTYPSVPADDAAGHYDNRMGFPGTAITGSDGMYTTGPDGAFTAVITLAPGQAHPGDNFRKVVAMKRDLIDVVAIKVGPESEAKLATGAVLVFDNINGGLAQTPLVTIWRKLWVERDYMGAPPADTVFLFSEKDCAPPTPLGDCATASPGGAQPLPDMTLLISNLQKAYIVVDEYPLDRNPPQLREANFLRNMDADSQAQWGFVYRQSPVGDVWYWTAYILSAYEPDEGKDGDPDSEAETTGTTVGRTVSGYSAVFLEVCRDVIFDQGAIIPETPQGMNMVLECIQGTVAHEIGHHFDLGHTNETLMAKFLNQSRRYFNPTQFDLIRDTEKVLDEDDPPDPE